MKPAASSSDIVSGTSNIVEMPDRHRRQAPEGLDAHRGDPLAEQVAPGGRSVDHHTHSLLARHVGHRDGHRVRAARHGHVGERERGDRHAQDHPVGEGFDAGPHRHPAAHVHAQPHEVGPGRCRDLVELEHLRGFAVPVDPPRLHLRHRPRADAGHLHRRVGHPGHRHRRSVPIGGVDPPLPSGGGERDLATADDVARHRRGAPGVDPSRAAFRPVLRGGRRPGGDAPAPCHRGGRHRQRGRELRDRVLRHLVGVDELHVVRVGLRQRRRGLPPAHARADRRRAHPRRRRAPGVRRTATSTSCSSATW